VQEFSGEKIESTIFGGNSCSYLDGRGDHKYFSWPVVGGRNDFSFTLLSSVTEAFERSKEFF